MVCPIVNLIDYKMEQQQAHFCHHHYFRTVLETPFLHRNTHNGFI